MARPVRVDVEGAWVSGILACFILLLFPGNSGAVDKLYPLTDDWTVRSWTVADGLPENGVRGLAFGSDGFLWLVTSQRLCRFDGVRFVDLGPLLLPGATAGLRLKGLHLDGKKQFWLYGNEGAWFRGAGGWVSIFPRAPGKPSEVAPDVNAVSESSDGTFWFVTVKCLYSWRNGVLKAHSLPADISGKTILYDITVDGEGVPWIAASDCVLRFVNGLFEPVPLPGDPGFPPSIYNIGCGLYSKKILTATHEQLFMYGAGNWKLLDSPPRSPSFILPGIFMERGRDDLWIGSEHGLYRFRSGQWSQMYLEGGTLSLCCRALASDSQGNVWVGAEGGLVRLSPRLVDVVPMAEVKSNGRILGVHAEGDKIWAGLLDGAAVAGTAGGLHRLAASDQLTTKTVKVVLPGPQGVLWLGTIGHFTWRFRGSELQVLGNWGGFYKRDRGVFVNALCLDAMGTLWIGAADGLFSSTNAVANKMVMPAFGPESAVSVLYEDQDGSLWCGYEDQGLWQRQTNGELRIYTQGDGMPGRGVFAICRDSDGVLWLGGHEGLARWDAERPQTSSSRVSRHVFGREVGIDSPVLQIVPDGFGRMWLGTGKGILVLNRRELAEAAESATPKMLSIRQIGRDEGMMNEECTGGFSFSGAQPPGNRLWFGTVAGVVTLDSGRVPTNSVKPSVRFEELSAGGVKVWRQPVFPDAECVKPPDHLRLPAGSSHIVVRFTALDFTASDHIRFSCRLESGGPQNRVDWSSLSNEREVYFEWLPAGDYRLRVNACSAGGVWSGEDTVLNFSITPWFWQTGWFAVLMAVLVASVAGGLVRLRQRRRYRLKMQRLEHQRVLQEERERIARDIHDEVGSGLTHVAQMTDLARRRAGADGEMRDRLGTIYNTASELTRQIDEIVWAVNPENDAAGRCVAFMGQAAEVYLRGVGIGVAVEWPEPLPDLDIAAALRHNMFLVLREALGNVVKHSGAASVNIRFEIAHKRLAIVIRDDGCGFDPAAMPGPEEGHDGIANMQRRMAKVGGRVTMESAPGQGTTIRVEVPL